MNDLNVVLVTEHVHRERIQRSLSSPSFQYDVMPEPSRSRRLVRRLVHRWTRSKPTTTPTTRSVIDLRHDHGPTP